MKKAGLFLVLCLTAMSMFAQLQIVDQKLIKMGKDDEIGLANMGKNGFLIIQNTKSEESKKLRTWKFTMVDLSLAVAWTKSMDYEDELTILEMNSTSESVNIVFYLDKSFAESFIDGEKVGDLTIMKIAADGEITKKDIEFKDKINLYRGNFIGDAYYFDASIKKEDVIMKIDFETMVHSSNRFNLPDNTDIVSRTNDGKNIYFRVKSYKKKFDYDVLYTIEDGVVIDKTPLKNQDNEEIEYMTVIRPDSTHKFMLGLSVKEILAKKKKDDIITYSYYITNLNNNDVQTINKIDQESSDMLYDKRDIQMKNSVFSVLFSSSYFLEGNFFLKSSCYRFNNKNFIVFDKYQWVKERYQTYTTDSRGMGHWETRIRFIGYFFTNSVIWCFNDNGEVEWSRNFEYEIFTTDLKPKTCSGPYGENSVSILGYFNKELSYRTISMTGDVAESTQSQLAQMKTKAKGIQSFSNSNSIIHLYKNKYLVWGNERNFQSENEKEKNKKKKEYDALFQIVEFE